MPFVATIDRAGRLVVPKALRDRLHLLPGTRLRVVEDEGRLVLSSDRVGPRLVEEDGYLVIDLGLPADTDGDHRGARQDRIDELVAYARLR